MLVFPQLESGAIAQFPAHKTRVRRTVRNVMADGSSVVFADEGAAEVRWTLPLRALSTDEMTAIGSLFAQTEGRLRTFTFVDPLANLLAWNGDLSKPVWQNGPALQMAVGVADPSGGTLAVRVANTGQAAQRLSQTVSAPGWFTYCLSAYIRSAGGGRVRLLRSTASGTQSTVVQVSQDWKRSSSTGALTGNDETIAFALELEPGATVEIFGLQAEAQTAASAPMATTVTGGVYAHARFDHDDLSVVAQSTESSDAMIRIVSTDGV